MVLLSIGKKKFVGFRNEKNNTTKMLNIREHLLKLIILQDELILFDKIQFAYTIVTYVSSRLT